MKFDEFLNRAGGRDTVPALLLCLDPGLTTGWATFHNGNLRECGQWHTSGVAEWIEHLNSVNPRPTAIVCEDYRVYEHKARQNAWKEQREPKMIGALEYWCASQGIPLTLQMASQAKGFVGDDRLQEWGYYIPGQQHARDAVRHGCYYLLFHRK